MAAQAVEHPEVFSSAESIASNRPRITPPIPDSEGRYCVFELIDWFDLMEDVYRICSRICRFFEYELDRMPVNDAERAKVCIREIEKIMPLFLQLHPRWILAQHRNKDLCVMLFAELMVHAGHRESIESLSRHIAGSADQWTFFARALVENNLAGQKDWRQAQSAPRWVKTATNNIAKREYWVPKYAVDPASDIDSVSLEEIAEVPFEAVVEPRYTQRSIAELEAAAKDDTDVAEYLAGKVRYPNRQRDDIWRELGWDRERGERVDRRYRRLRKRIRELGGGMQCRDYRPRAGISDANFTAYYEELWDGAQGKRGVWQHRDPYREVTSSKEV